MKAARRNTHGMIQEGQRSDFRGDLPNGVLDLVEEVSVAFRSLEAFQARDAQLKIEQELACRVVKLMPDALSLVVAQPKQLLEELGARALQDFR